MRDALEAGQLATSRRDWSGGTSHFIDSALATDPNYYEAMNREATSLYLQGKYQQVGQGVGVRGRVTGKIPTGRSGGRGQG